MTQKNRQIRAYSLHPFGLFDGTVFAQENLRLNFLKFMNASAHHLDQPLDG